MPVAGRSMDGVAVGVPVAASADLAWLTAAQMREVDRLTVEDLGLTLVQMMENAGRALADLIVRRFDPRTALILAGPGANGGGGIAAARHLANRGVRARIVLAAGVPRMGRVPRIQLGIAQRLGIPVSVRPDPGADVLVDALLGYALDGDPRGRAAELIRWANGSGIPVVALDLPSGLDATTGRVGDPCIRATATLTLAMPKAGLRHAPEVVGELYLADISIPPSVYGRVGAELSATPFREASLVRIV
jgi:NAD(P)H-hydrate epimerase